MGRGDSPNGSVPGPVKTDAAADESVPAPVSVQPPLIVIVGKVVNGQMVAETSWANTNLPGVINILKSTHQSLLERLTNDLLRQAVYTPVDVAGERLVRGVVTNCEGVEAVGADDLTVMEALRLALVPYIETRLQGQHDALTVPHAH